MHGFEVGAPTPTSVELVLVDRSHHRAETSDDGWWRASVDDAGPGNGYRFSLDGVSARPDGRCATEASHHDGVVHLRRGRVLVVAPLADDERCVEVPDELEVLVASEQGIETRGSGLALPVDSVVVALHTAG